MQRGQSSTDVARVAVKEELVQAKQVGHEAGDRHVEAAQEHSGDGHVAQVFSAHINLLRTLRPHAVGERRQPVAFPVPYVTSSSGRKPARFM